MKQLFGRACGKRQVNHGLSNLIGSRRASLHILRHERGLKQPCVWHISHVRQPAAYKHAMRIVVLRLLHRVVYARGVNACSARFLSAPRATHLYEFQCSHPVFLDAHRDPARTRE